ncbi:phage terminase large subunit family protein [Sulfitobacter sp. 1A15106]|uniref:phage terminase large subunit family protein n=1 Tax=Sulfitobacter sp. 1A15106 TaxID=3368590 RepID=UPI003746DE34
MSKIERGLAAAFARGIKPPPRRGVADWCEAEYYLPPESAAEPGLISFKRTPYSYGIMDAVDDPTVEYISLQMAAQLAKTTILLGAMGQICATPGMGAPILFLMPTLDNAEMLMKERFAPMIEASPALKKNTTVGAKGKGTQSMLKKQFTNGAIVNAVGSNAPAALASRPVKMLLADECDRFSASAGHEGDPLSLAIKRTSTFKGNGRKIIVTSTPTLAGVSVIERQYKASDQRRYHVPCHHCGHKHEMVFENLHWEDNDPETAYYACPECGGVWDEGDRLKAISNGEWIATRPDVKGHAGFKLNALASPWVGQWSHAVKEFIDSRGDVMLEQVFVNTYLGEAYSSDDLQIDEEMIIKRMTGISLHPVPADCLLLTAGVDVQRDRFEVTVVGWSENQSYILDHRKIYGDTTGVQVWKDLHDFLQSEFQHELGNKIEIRATAIDSGYLTQTVYDFVDSNPHSGYFAVKGVAGQRLIWEQSKAKKKGFAKLWLVGVDDAKTTLMERLKQGDRDAPAYIHISDMGPESEEWAKQLLAEYRAVSYTGGRPKLTWQRKSPSHRAEAMDCYCYALAVRTSLSPNWDSLRYELTRVPDEDDEDDGWVTF